MTVTIARRAFALAVFCFSLVQAGGFTGKKVVSGWYPSYGNLAVEDIPFSRYTHLDYFVFTTTNNANVISLAGAQASSINQFVSLAHAAGTTVSYTIGGYTGSQYFSSNVATAANRTAFARILTRTMSKYGFDGIDIDWEYPGVQGEGDNIVNSQDSSNLLLLLQTLRTLVPSARISMAAQVTGIMGPSGQYLTNMRGWVQSLDYLTVMAYDIFGFYAATTGPNSPLYATCSPADNAYSVDQGVNTYHKAGIPLNKILIGFPAYAYGYTVQPPLLQRDCGNGQSSQLYQPRILPSGSCGNYIGAAGQYLWRDLNYDGYAGGLGGAFQITRDPVSQTVSMYDQQMQLFITYDDPTSAQSKALYATSRGLAGVATFDVSGDDDSFSLVNAIRNGLGLS